MYYTFLKYFNIIVYFSYFSAITCHLQMGGYTVVFGENRDDVVKVTLI